MTDVSGSVIFVSGATSGIGAACARRFAAAGARLVLTGRRTERLLALAAELPTPTHTVTLDMRDREAVAQAIAQLPAEFAAVDILVNNAGLALGLGPAHAVDLYHWEAMVDTNIKGLMYCTRFLLPGMIERDRGHVVNLGSVAGTYPYPGGNVYGGTKAFVHQFSLNLRADLLGHNIRVTCVEPGMVETEFSEVRFGGDKEKAAKYYDGLTAMTGEDIAETIFWCTTLPAHVNVNTIELMPTQQAFSAFAVHRQV